MLHDAAAAGLAALPEDALAVVVSRLLLRDALALTLVCRFFWKGEGRTALSVGCHLAAANALGCVLGEVSKAVGCDANEDGLRTAAFVLRAHEPTSTLAASNHTLVARAGVLKASGANDGGQLGNSSVSQFSSTVYVPSPTTPTADYLARQQQTVERVDTSLPSPVRLPFEVFAVSVSAGRSHSLMVSSTGDAFAFGANDRGQL